MRREGTTGKWRAGPLASTHPTSGEISVMLLGGGPTSQHRSLGHGEREDGRSAG